MKAYPPGSTLGILGGGQLGRMLAMAAARLGIRTCVLSPDADPPAADVAEHIRGEYDDPDALASLAERADVVTFEFENVESDGARILAERVPVLPRPGVLQITQDRLLEKRALNERGLPTADYVVVSSAADIEAAVAKWGKCVVKTRRFGYDGKGQSVVGAASECQRAWDEMAGRDAIVERWVNFQCEASVLVARSVDGEVVSFDVTRNEHENNILRRSVVPSGLSNAVAGRAVEVAESIAVGLDYVGVLGVELFIGGEDILVNEIAPRVHNSGHWTLDACRVSQFEQHVRAVMGWPLGSAERHSDVVMTNLLGDEASDWHRFADEDGTAVHLYRKLEVRQGRKMGHVTRCSRPAG